MSLLSPSPRALAQALTLPRAHSAAAGARQAGPCRPRSARSFEQAARGRASFVLRASCFDFYAGMPDARSSSHVPGSKEEEATHASCMWKSSLCGCDSCIVYIVIMRQNSDPPPTPPLKTIRPRVLPVHIRQSGRSMRWRRWRRSSTPCPLASWPLRGTDDAHG